MTTPQQLMTSGDVARILRISDERVRQLADAGALPCTRTSGGVRLFLRDDVERLAGQRDALRACPHTRRDLDPSRCSQCLDVAAGARVEPGVSGDARPPAKRRAPSARSAR